MRLQNFSVSLRGLCLAAPLLLLSACGGGDSTTSSDSNSNSQSTQDTQAAKTAPTIPVQAQSNFATSNGAVNVAKVQQVIANQNGSQP